MTNLKYWLALNRTPYIGPVNFKSILNIVVSPKEVFENIDIISKQAKLNDMLTDRYHLNNQVRRKEKFDKIRGWQKTKLPI